MFCAFAAATLLLLLPTQSWIGCSAFRTTTRRIPVCRLAKVEMLHEPKLLTNPNYSRLSALQLLPPSTEREQGAEVELTTTTTTTTTAAAIAPPVPAFLLLNGVALMWGSQHVVIKSALDTFPSSSLLNFWRFALSALLFSPALFTVLFRSKNVSTWKAGTELGLYTFLGFALQSIGLESTTASRSAFLLYLNVKIVPFLAAVFLKRHISSSTWLSALLALTGTCLLSTDGGPPNAGEVWCIGAAFASAMFILRLEAFSQDANNNAAELNSVSFAVVAVLCGLWVTCDALFSPSSFSSQEQLLAASTAAAAAAAGVSTTSASASSLAAAAVTTTTSMSMFSSQLSTQIEYLNNAILQPFFMNPLPAIYLGVITTSLCNYLQTLGQRSISAERAAVIYSLDPVYGAVFSRIFLGEQLGLQGYAGALFILFGVWISARGEAATSENENENENENEKGSEKGGALSDVSTILQGSST